jgi:hypothetical protein
MPTRNINFIAERDRFLEKVRRGRYENTSEIAALRAVIDEGDASGVTEGSVFARVRETLDLPTAPR